jgi:site-specific DNA recombinase
MPGIQPVAYRHHFPELQIISFEQFNRIKKMQESGRKVPAKSASSPYIFSGLVRCPNCGGKTVSTEYYCKPYDSPMPKYVCRAHHQGGRVACQGWTALERTVSRAAIDFIVDLLENQLDLTKYVTEEARQMMWEEHEGKLQRLQGEMEAARAQLKNVQEMGVQGLMTPEEARPFVLDARERLERCQKQIDQIESGLELKQELVESIIEVCSDLRSHLEALKPLALQAVTRQVFKSFTIGKRGRGLNQKAWIESYELTPELKGLLSQDSTLVIDAGRTPGRR